MGIRRHRKARRCIGSIQVGYRFDTPKVRGLVPERPRSASIDGRGPSLHSEGAEFTHGSLRGMAFRRLGTIGATLAALACAPARDVRAADAPADLAPLLKRVCENGAIAPGGVAVVVRGGVVHAIGAFGRRVVDTEGALAADDPIPFGCLAAPTTALVCALAIEAGSLRWTTTLGDVLGDEAAAIDIGWRGATLAELASRRVAAVEGVTLARLVEQTGGADVSASRCRDALLRLVGSVVPKTPHGTHDPVNRTGPCLAALVLERSAHTPFEGLAKRLVFDPLALTSARFASELTHADLTPAWAGHGDDGVALAPAPPDARRRALAPAFGLRLSLTDAARLLAILADPANSTSPVHVSAATADPLTRPVAGAPAVCGWRAERRPWARGTAYFSSTRGEGWCSTAWIYPKRGYAIVVALNRSSEAAFTAAETLVEAVSSDDSLSGG